MTDSASRYNEDKPKISMIFDAYDALIGLAEVMMFGGRKYSRGNFLKGMPWTEVVDSLLRHTGQFMSKEFPDFDEESAKHHVFHMLCNTLFLAQYVSTNTGTDDRVKSEHTAMIKSLLEEIEKDAG